MARTGPERLSLNNLLASHNLPPNPVREREREFFIDNLLVRIH